MSRPAHETASSLARRALCPGSGRLERAAPDSRTADSDFGDEVHRALTMRTPVNEIDTESPDWLSLPENVRETALILAAREARVAAPFFQEHCLPTTINREARYGITKGGKTVFSAQLDVVYWWQGRAALILDYKSLWGDVEEASSNYQLLGQVACFASWLIESQESPALKSPVHAGIIKPTGETTLVKYEPIEQGAAISEVLYLLSETEKPDAPLKPGETQCKYCRAATALTCPALKSETLSLAKMDPENLTVMPLTLSVLMEQCAVAERLIECVRAETRRRLEGGEDVPGWHLAPGAKRRVINDAQKALEALTPHGVTVDQVLACVDLRVAQLEKEFKAATGLKGKAVTDQFNAALDGIIEIKENAPSLKRLKTELPSTEIE